jgi:SAM-dependent methyltransferase
MSDELQALCFLAGANSIFYGDKLLTAGNPEADRDEALFKRLHAWGSTRSDRSCAATLPGLRKLYDSAAVLAREVGARMAQRLDLVKIAPQRVADIGCATGDGIRDLQQRYPKALPLALDYALPMLRAVRSRTPRLQRADRARAAPGECRCARLAAGGQYPRAWSGPT